jgi:putative peptidoglycan lipid II flippase
VVNLLKSVSLVSLWTLASRVTGLVRELMIATLFGASAATDAFNVAFRIPNLLRRLFAEGAFSQAFVPLLAARRRGQGDEASHAFVAEVATALASALLLLSVLGVLAAPALIWLMASGLPAAGHDLAVALTRMMFPYIAFMSMVALCAGVLNTWQRFAVPAATPTLLNLCMVGVAWWLAPALAARGVAPIYALATGVMLGGVLQLTVQVLALRRLGWRLGLRWRPSDWLAAWRGPGVARLLGLMAPAVLGVAVAQVSLLINTQIASYLAVGSVSWLTYADRLMEFPIALLGVALGVVLLPQLADAHAETQRQRYSELLDWGLRLVVLLGVPAAVGLLVFAQPLVAVLYHHGAFGVSDVVQTARAVQGYGLGVLGLVAVKVLAPGFFAQQDIRTPVRIAVGVLLLTQLMNVALVPWLAHAGLALSIALGSWINAGWLLWGLRRRAWYQPGAGWWRLVWRVTVAALLLAWGLHEAGQWLNFLALGSTPWLRAGWLALVVMASALGYFAVLALMGVSLRKVWRAPR